MRRPPPPPEADPPPRPVGLLRFLAVNAALGVGLGWALLAVLIATDTMGLWTLLAGSDAPLLPILMLMAVFAVTVGAAVMGTAVLTLPVEKPRTPPKPYDPDQDRPG